MTTSRDRSFLLFKKWDFGDFLLTCVGVMILSLTLLVVWASLMLAWQIAGS